MLSNMHNNETAYRTLKPLGAIVCFQNKEVAHFMEYQRQFLKQLADRQRCLPYRVTAK